MTPALRTLTLAFLWAGCAHGRGVVEIEVSPRPGRECTVLTVGLFDHTVSSRPGGCNAEVVWQMMPTQQVSQSLPAMSDRSGHTGKRVKADRLVRRTVLLGNPRTEDNAQWRAIVDDVSLAGSESRSDHFDFNSRRYLVFRIMDSSRSGSTFDFPVNGGLSTSALFRSDPDYCADFSSSLTLFRPDPADDVHRRTWDEAPLEQSAVHCSETHSNVFVFENSEPYWGPFHARLTLANRNPAAFRFEPGFNDNYTVVTVVVAPPGGR